MWNFLPLYHVNVIIFITFLFLETVILPISFNSLQVLAVLVETNLKVPPQQSGRTTPKYLDLGLDTNWWKATNKWGEIRSSDFRTLRTKVLTNLYSQSTQSSLWRRDTRSLPLALEKFCMSDLIGMSNPEQDRRIYLRKYR